MRLDGAATGWVGTRAARYGVLLLGAACGPSPRPVAPAPVASATKASLYGDASLVPTRAGEHARAELALSAELQRAIEGMPSVAFASVSVRTPPTCLPGHVATGPQMTVAIASLGLVAGADADTAQADARALGRAWLGPNAQIRAVVAHAPTPPEPTTPPLPWLVATVLGLGASLGIALDRMRAGALGRRGPRRR